MKFVNPCPSGGMVACRRLPPKVEGEPKRVGQGVGGRKALPVPCEPLPRVAWWRYCRPSLPYVGGLPSPFRA